MAQVTIEGSTITPTTFLRAGARITVERTSYIDNLIRRGYVNLIEEHAETAEPILTQDERDSLLRLISEVPAESAAKSVWAEFLADKDVEYPADATKAQMIEAWRSHGADGPSVD